MSRHGNPTAFVLAGGGATGIAWVGSQWSNHAGPASLYARMPLAAGMIGLYYAVGNANHLPPWGGLDMLLSTNPIAAAVPAGEETPIVLDMATTVAAYGKVMCATLHEMVKSAMYAPGCPCSARS